MNRDNLVPQVEKAVAALKVAGAREVYLFSSAAKRTMRENSDVDMTVSGLPRKSFSAPWPMPVAPWPV